MYSALALDEILRQILEECDDSSDQSARKTLGRLSRCCKAWREAALDQLWCRLPTIAPLLSLIPGYAYVDGIHTLEGLVVPSDLDLFHSYAKRVRHLTWGLNIHLSSSLASFLETVLGDSKAESLLPRLVSFEGTITTTGDISQWSIVLSPSLRDVDIRSHWLSGSTENSDAVSDWITRLLYVSPNLKSFGFRGFINPRLNDLFASMSMLQSITIRCGIRGKVSEATLASMATFPHLQSLKLIARGLQDHEFNTALKAHTGPKFPALQYLHIKTARDNLIESIIDVFPRNTLHTLHVEFEERSTPKSISSVLEKLADKTIDTLQSLTILHDVEIEDEDSLDALIKSRDPRLWTIDTIRPLASIKTLKTFSLDTLLPPILRQEDVEEILGWWPRVEHVHLANGSDSNYEDSQSARNVAAQLVEARGVKSLILPKQDARGEPFDMAALSRSPSPTQGPRMFYVKKAS